MKSNDPANLSSHSQNPYGPPTNQSFEQGFATNTTDFEQLRQYHLKHEASIRSFGLLYWLGGGFGLFSGVLAIIFAIVGVSDQQQIGFPFEAVIFGVVYLVIALIQIAVGTGLRKFTPIGKFGGIIFGMMGLLAIPLGTLLSGYMLYLLLSAKGKYIFSPEYQEVLKATPHIVYKTPTIIVVFGVLLLILFIAVGILSLAPIG
ncbi:MAG: hypothetical protein CBD74_03645 [Saprospirales bacterium TMED214]|nr:MAG: hypothetical protein CBD74_03645 [Saprospirales bacterium TMED214]